MLIFPVSFPFPQYIGSLGLTGAAEHVASSSSTKRPADSEKGNDDDMGKADHSPKHVPEKRKKSNQPVSQEEEYDMDIPEQPSQPVPDEGISQQSQDDDLSKRQQLPTTSAKKSTKGKRTKNIRVKGNRVRRKRTSKGEETPTGTSEDTPSRPEKDSSSSYQPDPDSDLSSDEEHDLEELEFCKKKYFVFDSKLDLLFSLKCSKCTFGHIDNVSKSYVGSLLKAVVTCSCGNEVLQWESQPKVGRAPVGNLIGAAAILLSGNTFKTVSQLTNLMGVQFFSETIFYDIQRSLLIQVVNNYYMNHSSGLLQKYKDEKMWLSGDGRCHSPGYNAKYCSYTMMELTS
ncbi:hypothetical protein HOLleu_00197 [Holothuria leucospilota]|uniref:Uncharacterized protein n=1 Tax=Holothuria leucospilota TaxID=206669 RepID=A0A9Q1CNL9_HOLLE|nr:hypothetical protein HOLleu_00197 [Holothuria leucospilota]